MSPTLSATTIVAPSKSGEVTRKTYPNYKVIVLNDDFNTFGHVANCSSGDEDEQQYKQGER